MSRWWISCLLLVGCGHHVGSHGDDDDSPILDASATDGTASDGTASDAAAGDASAADAAWGCTVNAGWVDRVIAPGGAAIGRHSVAVAADGTVWVAFHDNANIALDVAHRAPASSTWTVETVEGSPSIWDGFAPAIAIDAAGAIHVVHQDTQQGALRYATRGSAASSTWQTSRITLGAGGQPSLAIDAAGGLHVVYVDDTALGYAYKPAHGSWTASELPFHGEWPSLAIAPDQSIHMVYTSGTAVAYAHRASLSDPFTVEPAFPDEATGVLAIDRLGGRHVVVDTGSGNLTYAYRAANASSFTGVPFGEPHADVPSIAVEPSGEIHVAYIAGFVGSTADLHYADKPPGGDFTSGEIPEIGHSQTGQTAIAFDAHGGIHVTHEADHTLGGSTYVQDDYLDRTCTP